MGQCCSSRRHLKKKTSEKNRNHASTTTQHSYYEDKSLTFFRPVRHPFTLPTQDILMNRDLLNTPSALLCDCSYSTICPHRPSITPIGRNGFRRYSEDVCPRVPTYRYRQRRVTAPSYSTWCPPQSHHSDLHRLNFPSPEIRHFTYILGMGAPIHSSTRMADLEKTRTSTLYASDHGTTVLESQPSFGSSDTLDGVYGLKFQPRQLSDFESSVIWV
jgi:hypothetical protein